MFFLAQVDELPGLIGVMDHSRRQGRLSGRRQRCLHPAGRSAPTARCGSTCINRPTPRSTEVKSLATAATKGLIDNGAFFSRPYGDNARMIMNRDAATVEVLKKLKQILDPNAVMNPGKLCF